MNAHIDSKTLSGFQSVGYKVANLGNLHPTFSKKRIMMMPFHAHNVRGSLSAWLDAYKPLHQAMRPRH